MSIFRTILISSLMLTAFSSMAQITVNPVAPFEFQLRINHLRERGNDEQRYADFKGYIPGQYYSSRQVKELALLFNNDYSRYQMVADVYPAIYDKENFYVVYDAFTTFSAVMRLHDYVATVPVQVIRVETTPSPPPVQTKPEITFPLCSNYMGRKGCGMPIPDNDFYYYTGNIFNQRDDAQRIQASKDLISRNCLSMAQLMKLALSLDLESNRLGFMKENFQYVYDLENYGYAGAVFSNEPYKNDWLGFAKAYLSPVIDTRPAPAPVPVCEVGGEEFQQLKATIKKQNFSTTQMSMAQQIITSKKCFTCAQVRQMMDIFSFSENKMELARFAWDYTIDKSNYYTLADGLTFSGDKEELLHFISLKK